MSLYTLDKKLNYSPSCHQIDGFQWQYQQCWNESAAVRWYRLVLFKVFFVHYYCNVMCFETWGNFTAFVCSLLYAVMFFEGGVALEMLWMRSYTYKSLWKLPTLPLSDDCFSVGPPFLLVVFVAKNYSLGNNILSYE